MVLVVNKDTQDKLKDIFKEDEIVHTLKCKEGTRLASFMNQNNNKNEQLKCITDETASIVLYGENMLIESAATNALLYLTFSITSNSYIIFFK